MDAEDKFDAEFYREFRTEVVKAFDLAQKLDVKNPTLPEAFTGTPVDRIERQLKALNVL